MGERWSVMKTKQNPTRMIQAVEDPAHYRERARGGAPCKSLSLLGANKKRCSASSVAEKGSSRNQHLWGEVKTEKRKRPGEGKTLFRLTGEGVESSPRFTEKMKEDLSWGIRNPT